MADAFHIAITVESARIVVDESQTRRAIRGVLQAAGVRRAEISVAVVDDPTIHQLNQRHLNHDYPTDVLSFLLAEAPGEVDGEIIVSADTAHSVAERLGWPPEHELLLYVVHGALHLVGFDDHEPEDRQTMRDRERAVLAELGIGPVPQDTPQSNELQAEHPPRQQRLQ